MKRIQLTQGQFAIVDDKNYEWLNQYKWCAIKTKRGYRAVRSIRKNGRRINTTISRFILNAPDNLEVDHENHNTLDEQESNIRLCTRSQNNWNQLKKGGKSQYKGVYLDKKRSKKWGVNIRYHGRRIYLGRFLTEIEAAKAYDAKAKELFGEFAYLNFRVKEAVSK